MGVVRTAPSVPALSAGEKRALVDRIVATPPFRKSERLISFLLHVCQMEATGLAASISEQHIGESVFGRSKNYDPSIDGIVRSHASRLRTRLDQYFLTEGIDEPVIMSIPRGGYVPIYESRDPSPNFHLGVLPGVRVQEPDPQSPLLPSDRLQLHRRKPWRRAAILTIALAVLAALFAFTALNGTILSRVASRLGLRSSSDQLWNSLFLPGRETTLVVGDAGVNMFANMARRQVTAEEYGSRKWLSEPLAQTPPEYTWIPFASRSYTPWFVVDFAVRLARLPMVHDGQLKSISARSLTLHALKNDQLILIDGPEYNPWELLLRKDDNFHVVYDGVENSISIINQHLEPGEQPIYKWSQTDIVSHVGYSLIALSKSLDGNGRILELEGSTAQGDEAAAEFVMDRSKIDPFLRKALNKDGQLANFEMVIQTNFVAGGNFDSRIVASRIYH